MATSYTNPGGTGDRTASVLVTAVGGAAPGSWLVNGNTADNMFWFSSATGCSIEFWFPGKQIIDEAKFYQQNATAHGTWQWQGSNDRTTWTDLGGTFTLGGAATQTHTTLAGNTTAYIFYRVLQVGGTASGGPYVYEFEFKIEAGGTASYLDALGSGDRTSAITVTSSGISWAGLPSYLVNGLRTNQCFWDGSAVAGHWIAFDLGTACLMQEARFYFSGAGNQGNWKFQGSPDATTWTDLSGTVTLGLTTLTHIGGFASNTTAYRHYRLLGVSGTRTSGPYEQEIEFMVGVATPPDVTVPDVVDDLEADAITTLTAAGLTAGTITYISAAEAEDIVVAQSPAAGALVAVGSAVDLDIHTYAPGTVVSQSPAAGEEVAPGTAVDLVVVLGVVDARVSQSLVEILSHPDVPLRVTLVAVELFTPHIATTRTTQLAVEIFYPLSAVTRSTQQAVEYFQARAAATRTSHTVVELFLVLPPCVAGDFPIDVVAPGDFAQPASFPETGAERCRTPSPPSPTFSS